MDKGTKAGAPGWDNFWKGQRRRDSFGEIMRVNTDYFGKQLQRVFGLKASDRILDYGCGPGFLVDYLAKRAIPLTGADINDFFIAQCREHHPGTLFIAITTDPEANRGILRQQLGDRRFDYIVLLSIAQYFKDLPTLERVAQMLGEFLAPGGRIIIADALDEKTSAASDALSLLRHCIMRGQVVRFVRFILYVLFSDYRSISKNTQLLQIPETAIRKIAERSALHFEKVNGLTIHATRTNYVLSKVKSLKLKA
jgi:2-polyprenyl-3-methyl-5-hydroxy-6-metoxy-1,4-benzoquinol methylase